MAESRRRFADRVAVVTGAASGIGRATALLLASEGAGLALLDRNGDGAEQSAAAIRAAGGEARAYACNVADSGAVRDVAARIERDFGRADVLAKGRCNSADWRCGSSGIRRRIPPFLRFSV